MAKKASQGAQSKRFKKQKKKAGEKVSAGVNTA